MTVVGMYACTYVICQILADLGLSEPFRHLPFPALRELFSGAAPLGDELASAAKARLGITCVRQGYGEAREADLFLEGFLALFLANILSTEQFRNFLKKCGECFGLKTLNASHLRTH